MSTTVDNRVVEMRFDNKQFETNVATSMSTLEKLKQSLNLSGATKGMTEVSNAARRFDLSGMGTAAETVQTKFSALQVAAVTALANITNSAVNAGKRMISALTLDPVKTGFDEYETKINAIQTIMSNTASKGTTMEDVTRVIGELNTYADKTIYNFAEMTRNIGTFTAAGVGLEESASAIQGIANLAASSGSTSQQASTAMYQLSQALAAGTVKLMDWNSVVNAGMGGEKFQEALKATAREHGVAVDKLIKKNGSFRESLQEGWITADILNETLNKFTVDGATQYAKSMMESGKWTQEQADALIKEAQAMEDAATKVKTFTQLWDTLKESAQSGWSQSWEIIVGDFEEAKELFSDVSEVLGGLIGASADSRNKLLQDWKDLGGRTVLIEGVRNAFEGIMNIAKPISEAFKEIFPPATGKQLLGLTEGFKTLTARFKEFTGSNAEKIKDTFKGIFAAIDIVVTIIKEVVGGIGDLLGYFKGLSGGILETTGSFGEWISGLRDTVKETDLFGQAVEKVVEFIQNVITKLKEFGSSARDTFNSNDYSGFIGFLQSIWDAAVLVCSGVVNAFSKITQGIADIFGKANFMDVLNEGLFAGILTALYKFISGLSDPFEGISGFAENITGILEDVRGCFQAYQEQLKAGTLLKIASAIGILAAAIFVISTIDPEALSQALGTVTILFGELMGSLAIFSNMAPNLTGVGKSVAMMIGMSIAITILAGALKKVAELDLGGIAKGLVTVGVLMAELAVFLGTAKLDGKMMGTATGIVILSTAMLILAKAVEDFGAMDWSEIGKGLTSIGILLAELALFTKLTGNANNVVSTGIAMLLLGASMKIFASAVSDFSEMNWDEIARGLTAMGIALAAVTVAMNFMPTNMVSIGIGLIAVSGAMVILADALASFGSMTWGEIAAGLVTMGLALGEIAIALNLMNGTLGGSAALIVAAGALSILAPVLATLGAMSVGEIVKSLVAMAGAFVIIGVAGMVLAPLVPTILGLSASFALLGLAVMGIGTGLGLIGIGLSAIATGITVLAAAGTAGATAFVAALTVIITGVANLIPTVATMLAEGVITFANTIAAGAPAVGAAIGALLDTFIELVVTYVPKLVNAGLELIVALLQGISNNIERIVVLAVEVVTNFIRGVAKSIGNVIQAGVELMISFVNGLADGVRRNSSAMINAVDNLMNAVMDAIKSWFKFAASNGKELIGNIISGIKTKTQDAITAAKTIGKNLIDGFVNGIKDKASKAIDAAKGVVSDALEGAKKLLGIKSPSRKFAEIGRYADEGLVVGLEKYAKNVVHSAERVGQGALDAMSKSLVSMSDVINSDVDSKLTIRPVMDLSNVSRGANAISNMLDLQPTVGVMSNIRAIGSGMSQGQNGTNNDVVSAINKLRKDLSSVDRASYNINGITYDDGSNVSDAVKVLVRAARMERRV